MNHVYNDISNNERLGSKSNKGFPPLLFRLGLAILTRNFVPFSLFSVK